MELPTAGHNRRNPFSSTVSPEVHLLEFTSGLTSFASRTRVRQSSTTTKIESSPTTPCRKRKVHISTSTACKTQACKTQDASLSDASLEMQVPSGTVTAVQTSTRHGGQRSQPCTTTSTTFSGTTLPHLRQAPHRGSRTTHLRQAPLRGAHTTHPRQAPHRGAHKTPRFACPSTSSAQDSHFDDA